MDRPRVVEAQIEVDFGQFYARRAGSDWASADVPSVGHQECLWSNGGFVYIGTTRRHGTTRVRVETTDEPPAEAADEWQHVAEVSLDRGGDVEFYSWGADVADATIPVSDEPLRLRVAWRGLVPGRFEGLDEDGNSEEELLVQLWPAEPTPPQVTRWWSGRVLPPPTDVAPDGRRQVEGLERVLERWAQMTAVGQLAYPHPRMPGGGEHSSAISVLIDQEEGSWWLDGYDVRRTLREVTEDEAHRLLATDRPEAE